VYGLSRRQIPTRRRGVDFALPDAWRSGGDATGISRLIFAIVESKHLGAVLAHIRERQIERAETRSQLIGLGMSPATGLAFMLATSATGFPAMVAVWALVKPRAFGLYLGFAITGALIAGYAYAATLAVHI
jgi:uncharacterized membrane protein YraQ (UPF0718 family)